MSTLKTVLFLSLLAFCNNSAEAQCCSAGSPAGAGTYSGLVGKKTFRLTSTVRFTRSMGYYYHDSKLKNPVLVKKSDFLFQGIALSYGISSLIAAELELGYFYLKDQLLKNNAYLRGYGLSNGLILIKTGIIRSDTANMELSGGAGLKFPFNFRPMYTDGVKLPIDIQPSTQAFGLTGQLFFKKAIIPYRLSIFSINRFEYNFANGDEYRYGHRNRLSLITEGRFSQRLGALLQVRYEYASSDYDLKNNRRFEHSGSHVILLSPLLFVSAGKWHVSAGGDIPMYKYYNGTQLASNFSLTVGLSRDFGLAR